MSQANVVLHEKYMYEHIPAWEHEVVHEEMQAENFFREASQNGVDYHLPPACYFSPTGTTAGVNRAWQNIKNRLSREVSIEFTIGNSYGLGLKPVAIPHAFLTPASSFFDAIVGTALRAPNVDLISALSGKPEPNLYGSLVGFRGKPK